MQNIGRDNPTTAVTMYVAHEGDTLQSISSTMYGKPSLWYMIADANGLSPTGRIRAGTQIQVPNSVRTGALASNTHRVYNKSDIIGSTLPNLKVRRRRRLRRLMIIIVIVIAVIAPVAIAALAEVLGPVFGALNQSTIAQRAPFFANSLDFY